MHCAHGRRAIGLRMGANSIVRIKQLVQVRYLGSIMSSSRRFGTLLGTSSISSALSMLAAGLVIAQLPTLPGLEITPASVGLPATPAPSPTPSAAKLPRGFVIAQAPPPETPPLTTPPAPAPSEVTPAPTPPEVTAPTPPGSTQIPQ